MEQKTHKVAPHVLPEGSSAEWKIFLIILNIGNHSPEKSIVTDCICPTLFTSLDKKQDALKEMLKVFPFVYLSIVLMSIQLKVFMGKIAF
jgi:hypothetical protein